jgi:hypothetical protein
MKKFASVVLGVFALSLGITQAQDPESFSVSCEDGSEIQNGVMVTVLQMRTGFDYTATVIGLNGFDPALAILAEDDSGLCDDNNRDAEDAVADLPTTREVESSDSSAQIGFSNNGDDAFTDIRLVVGSTDGSVGEFVLLLDGMFAGEADNAGDGFQVTLTQDMVESGVPLTVYMISVVGSFDPYLYLATVDGNEISEVQDNDGNSVACDDSGGISCWGESEDLSESFVYRPNGTLLAGGGLDSMLTLDLEGDYDPNETYTYSFFATSYQQTTEGDYVMAFHMATGEP